MDFTSDEELELYTEAIVYEKEYSEDQDNQDIDSNRSVWFSRSIPKHAIDTIRMMPGMPCFDETQIGYNPSQSFWFAELAKRAGNKCTAQDPNYEEVINNQFTLNEYEL